MSGHLSMSEAIHLNAQMEKVEPRPSQMTDHELRWAIRDGIARMYEHLEIKMEEK